MTAEEKLRLEQRIIEVLKTVYDPEIPEDLYALGLIYRFDQHDDYRLYIAMTLTAPNCPASDFLVEDIKLKLDGIPEVIGTTVNIVFEPEWDMTRMSEEAKLQLGYL